MSYPPTPTPSPSFPPSATGGLAAGPPKTSTTGPTTMLWFGIAGLVLAVLGVVVAVLGFTGLVELGSGGTRVSLADGDSALIGEVSGLKPNTEYVVCSDSGITPSQVRIFEETAEGELSESPLAGSKPPEQVTFTQNNVSYNPEVLFTTPAASSESTTYVIGVDPTVAGLRHDLLVKAYASFEGFPSKVLAGVLGTLLGVFGGLVGLGLTIGGAVWRSRRKRNARLAAQDPAAGPAPTAYPAS